MYNNEVWEILCASGELQLPCCWFLYFVLIAYFFSEKERLQCNVFESCGCLWAYLADRRTSEGSTHAHCNPFYDPLKYSGPLLPPAAALAPTIWPQFHLRWACPEEAQSGEIEAQCRKIILKNSEMQKVVVFLNFLIFTAIFTIHCLSPFVDFHYSSSHFFCKLINYQNKSIFCLHCPK
jgi:hypothetical protein